MNVTAATEKTIARPLVSFRSQDPTDLDAWKDFVEAYRPLLLGYCVNCGIRSADAPGVAHDVIRTVTRSIANHDFDPSHGRFRAWLFAVSRSKVSNHLGKHADVLAEIESAADWNAEFDHLTLQHALKSIRDEFSKPAWSVFWQSVMEHRPSEDIAEEFKLSLGAVYTDRSRVMGRLKGWIRKYLNEEPDFVDRL